MRPLGGALVGVAAVITTGNKILLPVIPTNGLGGARGLLVIRRLPFHPPPHFDDAPVQTALTVWIRQEQAKYYRVCQAGILRGSVVPVVDPTNLVVAFMGARRLRHSI